MRILIVDDESLNIMLLETILKRLGLVNITTAENGQEAFDLCKNNDFDIIFMDMRMPVMGGAEATKKIKEIKTVNIVALTTYDIKEIQKEYLEAGFDNYIQKPIRKEMFEKYFNVAK